MSSKKSEPWAIIQEGSGWGTQARPCCVWALPCPSIFYRIQDKPASMAHFALILELLQFSQAVHSSSIIGVDVSVKFCMHSLYQRKPDLRWHGRRHVWHLPVLGEQNVNMNPNPELVWIEMSFHRAVQAVALVENGVLVAYGLRECIRGCRKFG